MATKSVSAYLDAVGAEEWGKACSLLASPSAIQLRQLIRKAGRVKRRNCEEGLRLVLTEVYSGPQPYQGPADIAALRIKRGNGAGEGAGFALFHGDDGADYWITVRLEEEEWKITALVAQRLR